jgi:hypothetical protein
MSLVRLPYSEIIARLHAFDGYLASLDVRRGPDRLRQLIRCVEQCEEARQKGQLELLQQRPDVEDLVWSLVEGTEFARIYEGIQGHEPAKIGGLMQDVLSGPLHPRLEAPHNASNRARNTAFELRLGAGLLAQGAEVTLGSQADLMVDYKGVRLFVECKRPLHPHSIRKNVEKARRQLQQRLNDDSHAHSAGIVAISVSKAVNPGSRLFRADDPDALRSLSKDIISLHQQHSADYDRLVDLRLIGILYHLFTPAYVESDHLLTAAAETVVFLSGSAVQTMFPISDGQALKSLLYDVLQS